MSLFDGDVSSELARELLASANDDKPSRAARGAALARGLAALPKAAVVTTNSGSLSKPVSAAKLGAHTWAAIAAVSVGAIGVAAVVAGAGGHTPATSRLEAPFDAKAASAGPSSAEPLVVPSATTLASGPSEASSVAPRSTSGVSRTNAGSSTIVTDDLRDEIRRIDKAQRALANGEASSALGTLDAYDRAHERGAMRLEARVLRVEALLRAGRRAEAERLARAVLMESESGPYRARMHALMKELKR